METRKEQIIQAAIKRFGHFGYQKTTLSELADDLHITKANLYYYYADKLAIFKDVLRAIVEEVFMNEQVIIAAYEGGFMQTFFAVLDARAAMHKKYVMFQTHEMEEVVKGGGLKDVMKEISDKDVQSIHSLITKGIESGEIALKDPVDASNKIAEILRSISIAHKLEDYLTHLPNPEKIDSVLVCQKQMLEFIFEGKILTR